jgi:DNA-directed RNA polymerase specialized sigma24 family protein
MPPQILTATSWTVIRRAQGQGLEARAALEELISRYDGFILTLIRHTRRPPDLTLEDAKQEFLERLLKDLPRVVEGKGRFRGWLASAVHSYGCNVWKRWWSLKNAARHFEHCDVLEVSTTESAEHRLLQSFALDTLGHAQDLQRSRTPNPQRFEALRQFLPGPDMDFEEIGQVARRLVLSPAATRKAIWDLRQQFRECLLEAVADTLDEEALATAGSAGTTAAAERELAELYACLFPATTREVWLARV